MSLFFPILDPPAEEAENNLTETQELAKTETMLNQNTLDRLAEENEKALAELKEKNAKLAVRNKMERERKLVIQRVRRKLPYLKLPYKPLDRFDYCSKSDPLTALSKKEFDQLLKEEEKRYKMLIIPVLFWSLVSLGSIAAGSWAITWQASLSIQEQSFGIFMGSAVGVIIALISLGFGIFGGLGGILKKLKYGPDIS